MKTSIEEKNKKYFNMFDPCPLLKSRKIFKCDLFSLMRWFGGNPYISVTFILYWRLQSSLKTRNSLRRKWLNNNGIPFRFRKVYYSRESFLQILKSTQLCEIQVISKLHLLQPTQHSSVLVKIQKKETFSAVTPLSRGKV